jgi:hypothetical protein
LLLLIFDLKWKDSYSLSLENLGLANDIYNYSAFVFKPFCLKMVVYIFLFVYDGEKWFELVNYYRCLFKRDVNIYGVEAAIFCI